MMEKSIRFFIQAAALLALITFSTWVSADVASFYGPTQSQEGLYRIALKVQPDSVNLQQTMVAIFQANPDAFNDHNINGLKSGYKLQIPSLAQMQAISPDAAAEEIHRQNQRWHRAGHYTKPAKKSRAAKLQAEKTKQVKSAPASNTASTEAYNSFANTIAGALDQLKQQVGQLVTKEQLGAVQNQLSEDEKQNNAFRQDTTEQLAQVQQQNQQLTAQAQQMNQQLAALITQVQQMEALQKQQDQTITKKIKELLHNHIADLQARYGIYGVIAIGGLIVLLLIISLFIFKRRKKKKISAGVPVSHRHEEAYADDDTKDEYDFMNSDAGIPAKLDLARAYIDMEDFVAAETELKEVLKKGDILQKQEAERLLKKIK